MRPRSAFILAAVMLFLALPGRAVEVVAGWEATGRWNSNVLSASENEKSDFSIRTGPRLTLLQPRGDVTGFLRWRTQWEGFADLTEANGFDHYLDLDGTWHIDGRTEFELSDNLSRTQAINQEFEVQNGFVVSPGQVVIGRETTLQNRVGGSFTRRLSPTVELLGSVQNVIYRFDNNNRSNSDWVRTAVQLTRAFTPRTTLGVGAAYSRQNFDDTATRTGTSTNIYELFGLWNYRFSRSLYLTLSAGPSWNRPDGATATNRVRSSPTVTLRTGPYLLDASSCPSRPDGTQVASGACSLAVFRDATTNAVVIDPATLLPAFPVDLNSISFEDVSYVSGSPDSSDRLTYYGRIALTKEWEHWVGALSYQRSASTASGLGVSTNLDVATATLAWTPSPKWRARLIASWQRQTAASEQPQNEVVVVPGTLFVASDGKLVDDPALAAYRVDGAAVASGLRVAKLVDNGFRFDTYRLELGATRHLTKRTMLRGKLAWWRQRSSGDLQSDSTIDDFRVEIGVIWEMDPLHL